MQIVYCHQGKEALFHSDEPQIIVGRSKKGVAVELDLTPDERVSRPHARLWMENELIWIEDLDSKNGTQLNGAEIKGQGKRRLRAGDSLRIGDTILRLQLPAAIDPLLKAFLEAPGDVEAERALDDLLEYADELIRGVIRKKLGVFLDERRAARGAEKPEEEEAQNIYSDAILSLVKKLRRDREQLRCGVAFKPISNFRNYVYTVAHHAFDRHLAVKYPIRLALKDRLRYLLRPHPKRRPIRCALWTSEEGAQLCGLAQWQHQQDFDCSRSLQEVKNDARVLGEGELPSDDAALLEAIFRWAGHPVELEELTGVVAELRDLQEVIFVNEASQAAGDADSPGERGSHIEDAVAPQAGPETAVEWDQLQRLLWKAICRLSLGQRRAFLLHEPVTAEFEANGIVSRDEIAAQLEMPPEELERLWKELPIEDNDIARRFGDSRGVVIKRRFDARRRLEDELLEDELLGDELRGDDL